MQKGQARAGYYDGYEVIGERRGRRKVRIDKKNADPAVSCCCVTVANNTMNNLTNTRDMEDDDNDDDDDNNNEDRKGLEQWICMSGRRW